MKQLLDDAAFALTLLTRLPLPAQQPVHSDTARAVWAFPLVGALVGLIAALFYAAALALGLPPLLGALIALAASALVTGALHEDGLADLCDGFGGGWERAAKLTIMHDSRLGTYGALGLFFALALLAGAIAALAAPLPVLVTLIAAGTVSRAAIALVLLILPPARNDGLAATAANDNQTRCTVALALGALIAILMLGVSTGLIAVLAAAAGGLIVAALAHRQIGGFTGDVLGAAQQVAEIGVLLAVATGAAFYVG